MSSNVYVNNVYGISRKKMPTLFFSDRILGTHFTEKNNSSKKKKFQWLNPLNSKESSALDYNRYRILNFYSWGMRHNTILFVWNFLLSWSSKQLNNGFIVLGNQNRGINNATLEDPKWTKNADIWKIKTSRS